MENLRKRCNIKLITTKESLLKLTSEPTFVTSKNVIKRDIQHSDHKDVLFNNKRMHHQMKTIRSESHQISSYQINKVSLSPFDDKRYIRADGISSYALRSF